MFDSDGDLPSEATISNKLRDIVITIHKTGNTDDLTVKRVRTRAEKELGLDEGFFKTNSSWKQKSQDAIVEAVGKYCNDEPTPNPTPKKAAKPKPVEKKTKAASTRAQGVKRKAAAPAKKPTKRRKTSSEEESDTESEPPKKPTGRGKKVVAEDSDEEEEAPKSTTKAQMAPDEDRSDSETAVPVEKPDATPPPHHSGDVSESDMSDLIDESPVKKSRKKKEPAAKTTKGKASTKPKAATAKSKVADDPDEAEIKRLQGWLVKCGIRKVWSRDPDLVKCDTSKEKIRVLKNMLRNVGMDGKYSNEKAATIKGQRDLAQELAAIQEGDLAWGKTNEVTSTGRPSRRAAVRPVPQQKVVLDDDSDDDEELNEDKEPSGDDAEDDDVEGASADEVGETDDDSE